MTQEEKEKAYDEAIQKANNILEGKCKNFFVYNHYNQRLIEYIFPELAESEGENIRRELIRFVKGCFPDETSEQRKVYLAWLEKQNSNVDNANKEYWRGYREGKQEILDKYAELEKQGQKPQGKSALEAAKEEKVDNQNCVKPADKSKIKPKFKTGDRVIGIVSGMPYFITEVCDDHYYTESGCMIMFCSQDNFELYEPKPIEWSEEDKENFKHLMNEIVCLGNSRNSANRLYYDRLIKFIEELKNRVQPKEKWCNKDERMLDRLIAYFEKQVAFTDDDNPRYANWLKSLRPQNTWKPSDEQMKLLKKLVEDNSQRYFYTTLKSLYEQLKKLKG